MEEELVTAGTFTYEHEARLFSAKLESEGVECFFDNNFITSANPFLSNAVGGVKVNVRKSDVAKVREILATMDGNVNTSHINSKNIELDGVEFKAAEGYCPNCDSETIYMKQYGFFKTILGFFSVLLFSLPPPISGEMYCADCYHKWKK